MKTYNPKINNPDMIIPINLQGDYPDCKQRIEEVLLLHKNYGFTRFTFFAPSKSWRSVGYPPREHYADCAKLFAEVKSALAPYGIECGWTIFLTVKSGHSDEFESPVKENGAIHPFASCPLDPNFRKHFSEDVALFAKIARPDFIFTEDDFSVEAVDGCFCENHLREFARRQGKYYSREELLAVFAKRTSESLQLLQDWRALKKDTMVGLAEEIRHEVDKETPEIPIGYMQSGGADYDGDATEAVARALAGPKHKPFSRLFGAFYCGVDVKAIPERLYHPLYSKQHIGENFAFYYEADTYPHTRFYMAARHMKALMGAVYSYGFDGSVFWPMQSLDKPFEEQAYGKMYCKERKRFQEIYEIAKKCELKGVQILYDPFANTIDKSYATVYPFWTNCIGRFGIPYTTTDSEVAFWDVRQARYSSDEMVMDYLSKGLFLDGDAAKALCQRGYGRYLGVAMGDDVIANTPLVYDLGIREVINEPFIWEDMGKTMPCAHAYAPPGNGKWLEITLTDKKCEVITGAYDFQNRCITPTMTRFENELGGKVIVMSLTLERNHSQALYNYRRQRLFQELLVWCNDKFIFVKDNPDVAVIVNEAKDSAANGFLGMITLINLCEDDLDGLTLHLPLHWQAAKEFAILDSNGIWKELSWERTDDGIAFPEEVRFCEPVYILAKC